MKKENARRAEEAGDEEHGLIKIDLEAVVAADRDSVR